MCATYFIDDGTAVEMLEVINELNKKFGYETVTWDKIYPDGAPVSKDVYPKNTAPVGVVDDTQVTVIMPVWGFPRKESSDVGFNARSENVRKFKGWSSAYESRRAFAPARGFYENKKQADGKSERYYFTAPDGSLLFFASMLETVEDEHGNKYDAYTILTADANDSVKDIHHRMPILLQKDELMKWMTDQEYADSILSRIGPELVSALSTRQSRKQETDQLSLFD